MLTRKSGSKQIKKLRTVEQVANQKLLDLYTSSIITAIKIALEIRTNRA
jgi:hypothetical protein